MNLSEAWNQYEADKKLEGFSQYTLASYTIQKNLLIRHLGDVDVGQVTLDQLKQYIAKDMDRLKPSTVCNRVRAIKSLFKWIHMEGYVNANPARKLREPKEGKRIPKSIPEEMIEEIRESCVTPLEHVLVELFYTTGCRIGEVYGLNRNSIDWENRSIYVIGKGDKEREVYFSTRCAIWLKRYIKSRKDLDTALIVTERAPRRMAIAQIRYVVKRIAKRADIDGLNIYPHKFRHSFAMHLLDNGADMGFIQEMLGHAKIETTQIYAQLNGERRRQLYKKHYRA